MKNWKLPVAAALFFGLVAAFIICGCGIIADKLNRVLIFPGPYVNVVRRHVQAELSFPFAFILKNRDNC